MPKYVKGQSGNPYGRPKRPEIEELRKAIKTVEAKKRKKLLIHFVERAYESDDVLKALGKKIIPDLASIDNRHEAGDRLKEFLEWLQSRS